MNDISKLQKRQAILEEKLYKSIKYFLHTCQIFCVAPVDLQLATKSKRVPRWTRIFHYFWCFVMLISILTSTYFQYAEFDSKVLAFLTRILYFGEYVSGIVNSTLIIIGCNYQLSCYHQYFHRLISIDSRLNSSGGKIKMSYNGLNKFLHKILFIYLGFFGCVIATDFMYNRMEARSFFRSSTVYSIPNIISSLALSEYVLILASLCERYRQVVKILTLLPKDNWPAHNFRNREKPNAVSIVAFSPKFMHTTDYSSFDYTIENLRLVCLDLTDLHSDANASFGILIVTTVVSAFLILSIQFYALYTFTESLQDEDVWLTIYTILWIILHGGKSFFILYYNNAVQKEKGALGPTLYKMESIRSMDHYIAKFSLQILHENRTRTACGILKLDLTFLTTLVGALTTYLVILIQFDAAARSSNNLYCGNATN